MARSPILAINGDPDFLNIVRDLLQDKRYNVTTTNYVSTSFDQIAALNLALLIVDLVSDDKTRWDLLERLHAGVATRGIPVIAVSTEQRLLDRAESDEKRYGVRRVLIKPLDLHKLLAIVDELIGSGEA